MIAVPATPPACVYGKERLHADAGLPGSAFMKPAEAVRLVLAEQLTRDVEVVWVRRLRWGKFAFARCSGVADDRLVYVVRLRFPNGFLFRHGIYDPGTLVDAAIDAGPASGSSATPSAPRPAGLAGHTGHGIRCRRPAWPAGER